MRIIYLINRRQFVSHNNVKFNIGNIKHGVPQGSILGPILFLIYTNDISNSLNINILNVLFADDTNVSVNNKNFSDLIEVIPRIQSNVEK